MKRDLPTISETEHKTIDHTRKSDSMVESRSNPAEKKIR
jgi:hypothetical protein